MSDLTINERHGSLQETSTLVQWFRRIYLLCAGLLAAGIAVQVFFAGASLLVDGSYLLVHRDFGHYIEYIAIATLLIGLGARLPWRVQRLGLLFFVLMFLQYVFLYVSPVLGLPALRALHAVNALAMFWLAVYLTQRVWHVMRRPR